jgi:hypothetical protein
VKVEIDTLDHFAEEQKLSRNGLIKIDVEGFEMEVLKGAAETLRRFRPKLFVEMDDRNLQEQGSGAKELIAFLKGAGYRITNSVTAEEIHTADHRDNCHIDIICIPLSLQDEQRQA